MKSIVRIGTCIVLLSLLALLLAGCGSPAPAPAPAPSPKPATSPAAGGALALEITPVLNGKADADITVTATSKPGAKCVIKITNPKTGTVSSYPTDKEKVADASGKVSWTWKIPRQVAKGDGGIEITATLGSDTVTKTALFRVTDSQY